MPIIAGVVDEITRCTNLQDVYLHFTTTAAIDHMSCLSSDLFFRNRSGIARISISWSWLIFFNHSLKTLCPKAHR
jgi:hypothetical protein